ncbi:GNAT family N-acetyltransferase [Myxococcus sp. K15C18031901]|uniref:GNAT family N-acetyltransferase n=1 Tax=Myxococcus dinghuensis TaxID=2906761 RepID=UPI0020A8009A|nr:GNAT family N-acetyltransferase [Myxococcus dinghuensis]MCP3098241.1 GNAT family N-acetyltransferase [Myxococcus dinghuensis]
MVEIRSYDGDAVEAARFVNSVWTRYYANKVPVTDFSPRFLDWMLFGNPVARRDYMLAAYSGSRLVGTLFAEPIRMRLGERDVDGTFGSWASVDPEFRGQGVMMKLSETMATRIRERGAACMLACVATGSTAQRFWERVRDTRFLNHLGLWVHVFDADAVVRWSMSSAERALFTLARPLLRQGYLRTPVEGVRPYRPEDLSSSMALVARMLEPVNLGYAYTAQRLAHQLQYRDVPNTLVLERDGAVRGLANYYTLRMKARGELTVGLVDLMAFHDSVTPAERAQLLAATMRHMAGQGASIGAMLRGPCVSTSLMWRSGWMPWSGGARVVSAFPAAGIQLPTDPQVFVHMR